MPLLFFFSLALGIAFFSSLRFTIRLLPRHPHPKRLLLTSFLLRWSILVAALWYASQHDPKRLLWMAGGLLVARLLMLRWKP